MKLSARLYCRCLDEMERGVPGTIFCRIPCSDQIQIIEQREELEKYIKEKINKEKETK